ncbi:MAG: DUF4445 domain-containing protein [Candidatus Caldatribacterium sp.]|nr:DUF4445 domain-containing protein [Candidatus Caldatribacterium sp.]
MVRVRVVSLGRTLEGREGESLFSIFQREGIPLESYCGGMGSCGKCLIRILKGNVSPPTDLERAHLGERVEKGFRLACQVVAFGDIFCDVSFSLRGASFTLLGEEGVEGFALEDLPVQRVVVPFRKPPLPSVTSLKEELSKRIPLSSFSREALRGLSLLGEEDEALFEVFWDEKEVFAVSSPPEEEFLGVAFDLGTTTVAGALLSLRSGKVLAQEGALNEQVRFGADVISRLRAIQDHPENLEALQRSAIETMNTLIAKLCERTGQRKDRIFAVTVAGNTIMEHLFLGLSPLSIGVAPYVPVIREGYLLRAKEVGLSVHQEASVYVLPCVAGYVGGDIVGGIGVFRIHEAEKPTLYIDVGTNGEIVLAFQGKIFACGTAAGPAFEGAGIRFGMRASLGAISAVSLENGEIALTTIGGVPPRGICGTGLIDTMAELRKVGILSPKGRLQGNGHWSLFLEEKEGEKRFVLSKDPYVFVTEKDVEKLQLALAALRAGRSILLKEAHLREEDIEEVVLAGAFGSYIRPESARTIGLIPKDVPARSVGNASLAGARRALLSREFRETLEDIARRVHYVELSARRDFEDAFCEGLILPE